MHPPTIHFPPIEFKGKSAARFVQAMINFGPRGTTDMDKTVFAERYRLQGLDEEKIQDAINTVVVFEDFIQRDLDSAVVEDIKRYVAFLIKKGNNTPENLIHIARYFNYTQNNDLYVHLTKYFNAVGVLQNIIDRIL